MRIRGCTVEYDLDEAAKMLELSPDELKRRAEAGQLRYYYRLKSQEYRFHDASISANQELLTQHLFTTKGTLLYHLGNIR